MPDARTLRDRRLGYAALRVALGLNFLLHGLTRLADLNGFATGIVGEFEGTILPADLVRAFATVLPFAEGAVGLLVLLGLFTRGALLAGVAVMLALLFGSGLQQNWGTVATQMAYVLYFAALLAFARYNAYSLDARRGADA